MQLAKWQLITIILLTALTTRYVPKIFFATDHCGICKQERIDKYRGPLPILGDGKVW